MLTDVAPVRFVPWMVTSVPPAMVPRGGTAQLIVGSPGARVVVVVGAVVVVTGGFGSGAITTGSPLETSTNSSAVITGVQRSSRQTMA